MRYEPESKGRPANSEKCLAKRLLGAEYGASGVAECVSTVSAHTLGFQQQSQPYDCAPSYVAMGGVLLTETAITMSKRIRYNLHSFRQ